MVPASTTDRFIPAGVVEVLDGTLGALSQLTAPQPRSGFFCFCFCICFGATDPGVPDEAESRIADSLDVGR